MKFADKLILVTGGASGIGRELVLACVRRGATVAIADRNIAGARETQERAASLCAAGRQCSAHELDVTELEAWRALQKELEGLHRNPLDGLINNAGITFAGRLEDTGYESFAAVMSVNFMGMVYGTKEFLPVLRSRPEAVLANVSSLFGLMPMKSQSAYCASKYAIRGFTEVIAQELRGTNVSVSSVHPGHVGTDLLTNALESGNVVAQGVPEEYLGAFASEFSKGGLTAPQSAEIILDGLEKKQRLIPVGPDAQRAVRLGRLFPQRYADYVNDKSE